MSLFDFVFPKYCVNCRKIGEYICPDCFARISFDVEKICPVCNRNSIDSKTHPGCKNRYTIEGVFASIVYKGMAKRLISAFKYKPYLSDLQHVLGDLFYEGIIQQEQFNKLLENNCIFVPIPLHPEKLRQRGYNQAEILAKDLGKRFGIPVIPLLKRVKKTHTQITLKREERMENISGAFEVDKSTTSTTGITSLKHIILVDDVITSGATMLEAGNVLKRNGVSEVWGIALAHGG